MKGFCGQNVLEFSGLHAASPLCDISSHIKCLLVLMIPLPEEYQVLNLLTSLSVICTKKFPCTRMYLALGNPGPSPQAHPSGRAAGGGGLWPPLHPRLFCTGA